MNENLATVGSNALVLDSPEDTLTREAGLIEQQASSVVVTNDAEYAAAGDLTKAVKQMQKKVKDYWEPMRVNAKAAYDEVLAHKKEMLDPLEAAEKILKGKMGDYSMEKERKRRAQEEAMRKLAGVMNRSQCTAIFINQLREKVGVIYGNPEVTPGGRALKFYSSVRIEVRKAEVIKSGTDIIGARTRAKVVKNKIAPPFRTAEFDVMYGTGISRMGELLDMAVRLEVVQKSGAWFSYNGERIGQGRDNSKEFLTNHPEIADEIEKAVRENVDKLYDKIPNRPAPRDVAKPVELPAQEEAPAGEVPAPANKAAAKKSIDITVDDD